MKIRSFLLVLIVVLLILKTPNLFGLPSLDISWQDYYQGIKEQDVRCLAVHPKDKNIIFAGTDRAVYKSDDAGNSWKEVLGIGAGKKISYLSFNPDAVNEIYAATSEGLYASWNLGKSWKKIFTGMGQLEEECLCVRINQGIIFLGTRKALFLSFDKGKTWQGATGISKNLEIIDIAFHKDEIYLVTSDGIYRKGKTLGEWDRILVSLTGEAKENGNGGGDIEADSVLGQSRINKIVIDPQNPWRLFLATINGVVFTEDKGESWRNFPSIGLKNKDIRDILISNKKEIFAATGRGVYVFTNGRWQQLYEGLVIEETNAISQDFEGRIWLAAKGGIFKLATEDAARSFSPSSNPQLSFGDEPTIQELQKEAINYAEVAPEKIKNWRRQAQIKAIMPEVSLDFDRTVTTALGATYDRTAVGPQDWGVSLKWDVGELIWNNDQTSIDSRSKLMVELRDDIINELTRLYFERRRLQMELVSAPPPSEAEKMDRELRLQELTALIDGLTGGYLTKSLKRNKL